VTIIKLLCVTAAAIWHSDNVLALLNVRTN